MVMAISKHVHVVPKPVHSAHVIWYRLVNKKSEKVNNLGLNIWDFQIYTLYDEDNFWKYFQPKN